MKKVFLLFLAVLFLLQTSIAQNITKSEYIEQYKDFAIREMKRMGVPAAITLAQGILETENGNSSLVKKSNNHFGIKCKSTWTSEGVSHDDDAPGECFRKYKHAEDSYRDHSNFLRGSDRYAFLFKLDPADYKGWAYGLRKAGYATNPRYPEILIKNIEQNNLQQYTLLAVKDVPFYNASKYKSDPEEDKAFNELTKSTVNSNDKVVTNNEIENTGLQQFENRIIINGSTAIPAVKGKSLLAIATEHNVNLTKLLEYNDLEKDGLLEKDQFIFLEKKSKEGEKNFYILQQNESLYDVAQKNGIRLRSLYEYNSLKQDEQVYAGTKLNLRPSGSEPVIVKEEIVEAEEKVHAVQSKEGLYAISKKYGVTVMQIKEWNNLPDDNLKVGQQLIISK
ncbi:MAG: LysM peptidoglycan-binding domain-containing protein [Chitinophagaceae bacterium]|jgi:flagellum-specific peptidoglycan hydrolase FlgJ|nr:LysM peptidoglycan-binding domain-containing protein [Chitinophagaceae bacterium]